MVRELCNVVHFRADLTRPITYPMQSLVPRRRRRAISPSFVLHTVAAPVALSDQAAKFDGGVVYADEAVAFANTSLAERLRPDSELRRGLRARSRTGDRLVAIAGIAEEFAKATGDVYLAEL